MIVLIQYKDMFFNDHYTLKQETGPYNDTLIFSNDWVLRLNGRYEDHSKNMLELLTRNNIWIYSSC